ncbi:ANM_HP_G0003810.mRNA.1.CDS.1 [Saccharomyces cerevisiae]|nr:ANM_HP_G0107760.mRNA.1.CDS.1 [Saccharomyces cerevisiae]CAI4948973.1 ANM_HP_G0125110.mRNA.1.CDS.1 [Saccharomyces cerevisiae]CAI5142521.1 ANM_HP_G0228930.mRNA.1.CDS.1 [Saccharomyces cerevisiae]CAI5224808.1 ANM_HP_G0003810.mRNA.1.CDS.1 [Saccharomyces cerevisiae]CAI6446929.1 ANM_HP_G0107760.mRNA.1.CDS.1 [Saccharomyces cerevisiae]
MGSNKEAKNIDSKNDRGLTSITSNKISNLKAHDNHTSSTITEHKNADKEKGKQEKESRNGTTQSSSSVESHSPQVSHHSDKLSSFDSPLHLPNFRLADDLFSNSSRRSSDSAASSSVSKLKSAQLSKIGLHHHHTSTNKHSHRSGTPTSEVKANYSPDPSAPRFIVSNMVGNGRGGCGLHGATSNVVKKLHSRKKWDWNTLPASDSSLLIKTVSGNHNLINICIDGEFKQIMYDPNHNELFNRMDLFLSFNMDSSPEDSLIFAKKRLRSYIDFLTKYLESRKYAFECYPFNIENIINIETEVKCFPSFDPLKDYSEIESLIQLWLAQSQKFLLQSNSFFFSSEVVEELIKRKPTTRQHSNPTISTTSNKISDPTFYIQQLDIEANSPRPVISDPLDEIDILLIRPLHKTLCGWQLAYDEPSLNIADFALDLSPWMFDSSDNDAQNKNASEIAPEYLTNLQNYLPRKGSRAKIVSDEQEVIELNSSNASEYMYDCMNRKFFTDDAKERISRNNFNQGVEEDPLNDPFASSSSLSLPSSGADAVKRKKSPTKATKKSGFVNFFKRKHSQLASTSHTTSPSVSPSISSSSSPKIQPQSHISSPPRTEKAPHVKSANQAHQNEWLENFFCRTLNNYKEIDLPTQFILPKEVKRSSNAQLQPEDEPPLSSPISSNSDNSFPNEGLDRAKSAAIYGKEYLKLRLPFASDTIPAVICPWVWTSLSYYKWKALLREIYRSIIPGGYALAIVPDLRISNTYYTGILGNADAEKANNSSEEFLTTKERDKTFDAMAIDAINKGLHIHPTKHLTRTFKDVGFTGIKSSVLSLKTGDFKTDMGFLNEFNSLDMWDYMLRRQLPDSSCPPKDTDPTTLFKRYVEEHIGKIDDNAGCFRTLYVVAQKPKLPYTK